MDTVTITGMERTLFTKPTERGHLILAYFTAKVGVFTLRGCALSRLARGGVGIWLPNLSDSKQRKTRQITLDCNKTRDALTAAALETFERMGGEVPEREHRETSADRAEALLENILPPPVRKPIEVRRTVNHNPESV